MFKFKRCHTCNRIIFFTKKSYHGVGRGVGFKDGKNIEFCARCSYEIFSDALLGHKKIGLLKEGEVYEL